MTTRLRARLVRRVLGLLAAALMMGGLALVAGASPASATACRTAGHAYLTQPGRVFFSGFEGDQRYGVPTLNTFQFDYFSLGGNGIRPGTGIYFAVTNRDTGAPAGVINGGQTFFYTRGAGSNCVVNEALTNLYAPQPGTYRVTAYYQAGNSGYYVADPVVDIVVQPSPPAPDPVPVDPCPYGYAEACF